MRLTWTLRQLAKKRTVTGRRFTLALTDKYRTDHFEHKMTVSGTRRFGDALQDALDGNYGRTHEWRVADCPVYTQSLLVENGKVKLSAKRANFVRLVHTIDKLLEND